MTNEKAPAGYMKDATGRLVPLAMIKPVDKLRDELVNELILQALDVNALLRKFKSTAFADIAALIQVVAEHYDAKVGGDKGNVTLFSFDGRYKIVRQVQETLRFDERLQAAKALIDECFTAWTANAQPELKVIVDHAFQVNQEGAINTDRVLSLKRFEIKDEKWLRAMDAIGESLQVVGSRSYVRFYQRVGDTDRYEPISLDLASV